MKNIYLDNAATTPILPEVIEVITRSMSGVYGNPSSSHNLGRRAKSLIETARRNISKQFNASASEIVFTAGGSEADNLIIRNAVTNLGVSTVISSKLEHPAVLRTIDSLVQEFGIKAHWVDLDNKGDLDYRHLEQLMASTNEKKLVSLMYVNNELGNLLEIDKVSKLCVAYNVLFHSDAVQAVGHFEFDVQKIPLDFFAASAHKFHGPKGVGFAYFRKGVGIRPMLLGGEQEKGARAGTENVHAILGMEKALGIACSNLKEESVAIQKVKSYLIRELKNNFKRIEFNGLSEDAAKSSYIILNVRFPKEYSMLLFNLDLKGIAVSGGSACQSGSQKGSHVLNAILSKKEAEKTSIRFSFSKANTMEEIDYVIKSLKELIN